MAKITDLNEKLTPASGDWLIIEDVSASQTKKIQYSNLRLYSNPAKFFAYSTSSPTSSITDAKVQFNNVLYDTGGNYDSVNNRFTCTIAGFYVFSANATWDMAANGSAATILYKNGTHLIENLSANGASVQNVSVPLAPPPIQLAVNDYIEIFSVATSAGWSINVGGSPMEVYFGGFLLSRT